MFQRHHTKLSKLDEAPVEPAATPAKFSDVQNSRNSSNSRMETDAWVLVDSEESWRNLSRIRHDLLFTENIDKTSVFSVFEDNNAPWPFFHIQLNCCWCSCHTQKSQLQQLNHLLQLSLRLLASLAIILVGSGLKCPLCFVCFSFGRTQTLSDKHNAKTSSITEMWSVWILKSLVIAVI